MNSRVSRNTLAAGQARGGMRKFLHRVEARQGQALRPPALPHAQQHKDLITLVSWAERRLQRWKTPAALSSSWDPAALGM